MRRGIGVCLWSIDARIAAPEGWEGKIGQARLKGSSVLRILKSFYVVHLSNSSPSKQLHIDIDQDGFPDALNLRDHAFEIKRLRQDNLKDLLHID